MAWLRNVGSKTLKGVANASGVATLEHEPPEEDLVYKYFQIGVQNATGNRGLSTLSVVKGLEVVPVVYLTQLGDDIPSFITPQVIYVGGQAFLRLVVTSCNSGDVISLHLHWLTLWKEGVGG